MIRGSTCMFMCRYLYVPMHTCLCVCMCVCANGENRAKKNDQITKRHLLKDQNWGKFLNSLHLTQDGNRSFRKKPESKDLKHPQKGEGCPPRMTRTLAKEMERRMSLGISQEERLQRKTVKANSSTIYFLMLLHAKLNLEEKHVWVYIRNHFCRGESPCLNCVQELQKMGAALW